MDAAKAKRTTAKSQFTRYEKRLIAVLDLPDADEWTLKTRYEDFKVRWERLQDAHDEYAAHLTEESEEWNSAEQWLDEIMERFDKAELEVGQKLKKLNPKPEVFHTPQ